MTRCRRNGCRRSDPSRTIETDMSREKFELVRTARPTPRFSAGAKCRVRRAHQTVYIRSRVLRLGALFADTSRFHWLISAPQPNDLPYHAALSIRFAASTNMINTMAAV